MSQQNTPLSMKTREMVKATDAYKSCVYSTEKPLFIVSLIFSSVLWLASAIFLLFYAPFIALFLISSKAIFLSYVKGYGVKISENQFPEMFRLAQKSAENLGLEKMPEMYLYNMDGMFNAFAAHFFSRDFVILTTAIVDACEEDEDYLSFIITHELTHLQRGHTRWVGFLAPSRLFPWLGKAYSKACEYTCDAVAGKYGLDGDVEKSRKAVSLLATASHKRSDKLNFSSYNEEQYQQSGSFWMTLTETNSTHPFTFKRFVNLNNVLGSAENNIKKVRPSIWGRVLAPFFSIAVIIWFYLIIMIVVTTSSFEGYMDAAREQASYSDLEYSEGYGESDYQDQYNY